MPQTAISITGNTPLKRKLYNRIIQNNFEDLTQFYYILGVFGGRKANPLYPFVIINLLLFQKLYESCKPTSTTY